MKLGYYYVVQTYRDNATAAGWDDSYDGVHLDEEKAKEDFKKRWINNRHIHFRLIKCFDSEHGRHIKEIISEVKPKTS